MPGGVRGGGYSPWGHKESDETEWLTMQALGLDFHIDSSTRKVETLETPSHCAKPWVGRDQKALLDPTPVPSDESPSEAKEMAHCAPGQVPLKQTLRQKHERTQLIRTHQQGLRGVRQEEKASKDRLPSR